MEVPSKENNKLERTKEKLITPDKKKVKITEKIKKVILNVVERSFLEVRGLELSPDGKYLITCSEHIQNENPEVLVWHIDELLEGENTPEGILRAEIIENNKGIINNWLLCIDSLVLELNGTKIWMICAGSICGRIYIWSGKIDKDSQDWIFKDNVLSAIVEENNIQNNCPKAIFDIDVLKNPSDNNSFFLYYAANNIHTISKTKTKDNTIKEIKIFIEQEKINFDEEKRLIGIQDEWITSIDTHPEKNYVVSGSRDGTIYKWNLNQNLNDNPILIGKHNDSVTCVKVFMQGNQIASSSIDPIIRIWNNNDTGKPNLINELIGHTDDVVGIDIQKNNKYLVSISKDDTMKIWDLDKKNWIRNIDIDYFMEKYDIDDKRIERGMIHLRKIKMSGDNRYFFATRHKKIVILRNFGLIWHFNEQLKHIKKYDKVLYKKIFGENLRQMAKLSPENLNSLKKLYYVIKKRLKKAKELKLSLKDIDKKYQMNYNMRELGSLFIPSFINFEIEGDIQDEKISIKNQRQYLSEIRDNYIAYWNSVKNLFFKLPDTIWNFELYVTTDMEEDIKDATFVKINDPKIEDSAYIIMKDRGQTQIRFLMVLNNIDPAFIPLLSNINIDIEDDRGDKDNLAFSDFTYSKNFVKILNDPKNSLTKYKKMKKPENIYYSHCTFQIDDGYSTEEFINIFNRKIALDFVEKLNPLESSVSSEEDYQIFDAFRDNFQYPIIPKIQIQVGKGITSKLGKFIDDYFTKIIIIEFIFSVWGFLEVGIGAYYIFPDFVSPMISFISVILIGVIVLWMILKK